MHEINGRFGSTIKFFSYCLHVAPTPLHAMVCWLFFYYFCGEYTQCAQSVEHKEGSMIDNIYDNEVFGDEKRANLNNILFE